MNPTLALFWKEGREATYKVVACAGLAMIVGLVCAQQEFPPGSAIIVMSHMVGLFGAVLMGMDAVALERSRMTLSFLLCRPLALWQMLTVKFVVGAGGLLAVLASYWGGTFIGLQEWAHRGFQSWDYSNRTYTIVTSFPVEELLSDVGYILLVLLWFITYLIPYGISVLASILTDRPLKSAITSLMAFWVGIFLLVTAVLRGPKIAESHLRLVFSLELNSLAGILRQAFDPSLVLVRGAATALLVGGAMLLACRVFTVESSKRIPWAVGTLALICAIVVVGLDAQSRHRHTPVVPVEPVGMLHYKKRAVDLALKDGLAVVLLERGLSLVDVTEPQAPEEIGCLEKDEWWFERLALYGSRAYAWGQTQDSVGVAVFDLSRPDRPLLQALSLLHPVAKGPTPWLWRIPRLVGWGGWDGHLYAGLLRSDFLELFSFDLRESGPPALVDVLSIEETTRHIWTNEWEMRIVGPHVFMALGHDFAVLDLTDPRRLDTLSRIPLRRFGRAATYEKLIQEFREQVTSRPLPEPLAEEFEKYAPNLAALDKFSFGTAGKHVSFVVPPGLGPLAVWGDKAYIERALPREIAVVDISDPVKPVEVDYIPWTRLPRRMTTVGESAFALERGGIQTYVKTGHGTFSRQQKLGFDNQITRVEFSPKADTLALKTRGDDFTRDMFIVAGDHIYALLNNNLAIFKNPRRTE